MLAFVPVAYSNLKKKKKKKSEYETKVALKQVVKKLGNMLI